MNQQIKPSSTGLSKKHPQNLQQLLVETVILPILMPYSETLEAHAIFSQFAKTFVEAMDELDRRLKPFLDEMLPVIQKFVETDWTAVFDAHEKSFLYLADCGWTLPDWVGLAELRTLHLRSPEELDRYFVDGYMANDAENLKELGMTLRDIPRLSQWHLLIDEIISSIAAGNHRVAIPAILTVMEGYLASALVKASLATPKVTSPFKVLQGAKWHEDNSHDGVYWKSGIVFLSRVFAPSDFAQQPPAFINRHWILHGRASVDWTLSDALRLVNSLTMLDFLFVTIGQPKPNALQTRIYALVNPG
jgi:hypothetical protein